MIQLMLAKELFHVHVFLKNGQKKLTTRQYLFQTSIDMHDSDQIIATSHDLTLKGSKR